MAQATETDPSPLDTDASMHTSDPTPLDPELSHQPQQQQQEEQPAPQTSVDEPPDDPSDDPILSSYDIYLTDSQIRRLLLQYPDRPSYQPYNEVTQQKPLEFRLKPRTGLIEVDVPVNTRVNYDLKKGLRYGNSMKKSRVVREGGAHGLAGGFNAGAVAAPGGGAGGGKKGKVKVEVEEEDGDEEEFDEFEQEEADRKAGVLLGCQTLGGRIKPAEEGDPLYMLGAFRGDELHLAPLSSVVQLRPQLHHLDAFDDVAKGKTSSRARQKGDDDAGPRAVEPEARTIDMKVKSAEGDNNTAIKGNNDILKRMQDEKWEKYNWIDEKDQESWDKYEDYMFNQSLEEPLQLESAIISEDYLDGMSAPRVDPTRPHMTGWAMKARRKNRAQTQES